MEAPESRSGPNRGPWIIAASIIVAAGIIAVALVTINKNNRCQELQDRWKASASELLGALDAFKEAQEMGCDWARD